MSVESIFNRNGTPFYQQIDYVENTRRDFDQVKPLPASYTWDTESKIIRIAKKIFSIIVFPIGLYKLLQNLAGKVIVPASTPSLLSLSDDYAMQVRQNLPLAGDWKYKRVTVAVDGEQIDAAIICKESTFNNGRWFLASGGNAEFYEQNLVWNTDIKSILSEVHGNAIVFNYPGVGASSGVPNRQAMAKAYRAMLAFLEDNINGIGAKEIIGYGHSIGGGVQGDALESHELKSNIKYIFIKSRTFSNLRTEASSMGSFLGSFLGSLVKFFGWNMDSTKSSKKLQVPEIILQTANVHKYQILNDISRLLDDGVIPAQASLAKALLGDDTCMKENKVFIGIPELHNGGLTDPSFLECQIERFWPDSPITQQIQAERAILRKTA